MNIRSTMSSRIIAGLLLCACSPSVLASGPAYAQAQTAPAYVATLEKLGATPEEIIKFNQFYNDAPAALKEKIEANKPEEIKELLSYQRNAWANQSAHPPLAIGAQMPQFSLKGVDGKTYTPESVKAAKLVVVVFMSNHCPASQMYEARLQQMVADYRAKGVEFLAIQPDGPKAAAPSEHNFTDVEDDFEGMKERARFRNFSFPYLYDGDQQAAAKAFGPKVTPHVFIFDQSRKLRFEGRIDNNLRPQMATTHEARDAIDALLANKEVAVNHTPVFGCSLKWNDRMEGAERERREWSAMPVKVETITAPQLTALRKTAPGKMTIINFWATWCGPCKVEMPEIVKSYQWYRSRGVDLVTVSVDEPGSRAEVQKFLETVHSPARNLQVDTDDLYAIQAAFDPEWQSGVPFTLVLGPDGQVIYKEEGEVNILKMRRAILANLDARGSFAGNAEYWKK